MTTVSAAPEGRLPQLDGLRGLAILLVMGSHLLIAPPGGRVGRPLELAGSVGWVGVDLFFVLSGFLITRILLGLEPSRGALLSFYARRALRILPLCLVLLSVLALGPLAFGAPPLLPLKEAPWYLFFLTNVFFALGGPTAEVNAALAPLWSLAVEEQFYLVWPWVVLLTPRRALLRLTLALALGSALLRILLLAMGGDTWSLYVLTPTHCDALASGAAVAILRSQHPGALETWTRVARVVALAGVLSLALLAAVTLGHWAHWRHLLGPGLFGVALTFAALLVLALNPVSGSWLGRLLLLPALQGVGTRSYALYLFHVPVAQLCRRLGLDPFLETLTGTASSSTFLTRIAIELGLIFLLAELSLRLIERPILDLRRFFPYRQNRRAAVPSRKVG